MKTKGRKFWSRFREGESPDHTDLTGFGPHAVQNGDAALETIGLPLPEAGEYLEGDEKQLIVLNRCGIVVTVGHGGYDIFDSAWVLPPLGVVTSGKVTVEVLPGLLRATKRGEVERMEDRLALEDNNFLDPGMDQIGRIPLRTPRFPDGAPNIFDRDSVGKLNEGSQGAKQYIPPRRVKRFLAEAAEVRAARTAFYAPLHESFLAALRSGRGFRDFWRLCEKFAAAGKLSDSWNDRHNSRLAKKAAAAARAYDGKAMRMF